MDATSDAASLAPGTAAVIACTSGGPGVPALLSVHGRPLLCYLLDELDSLDVSQAVLCTDETSDLSRIFGGRYRGMKLRFCPVPADASGSGHGERAGAREASLPAPLLRQAFALCEGKPVLTFGGLRFLSGGLGAFVAQCATKQVGMKDGAVLAAVKDASGEGRLSSAGACWVDKASAQSAESAATLLGTGRLEAVPPGRILALEGACICPEADPAGAEAFLKPRSAKGKAVFFDRDGTVNVEKHYLYRPEELEFIYGMPEFIALWQRWGYRIIVATNQSGIARGYYGEEDMEKLHACMNERLRAWGARIDAFYHCPHHPDITGPCLCRKPMPGLIEKAIFDFNLDPAQCLLFGDKDSDIIAGQACGIFSVKVLRGSGLGSMPNRNGNNLHAMTFPWPPLEENQAISR